jgi:hypothetical protein
MLFFNYIGGNADARKFSMPILHRNVLPPKDSKSPGESPASTGMNMVVWLILCATNTCMVDSLQNHFYSN